MKKRGEKALFACLVRHFRGKTFNAYLLLRQGVNDREEVPTKAVFLMLVRHLRGKTSIRPKQVFCVSAETETSVKTHRNFGRNFGRNIRFFVSAETVLRIPHFLVFCQVALIKC